MIANRLLLFCLATAGLSALASDLPQRTENKVFRAEVKPAWLPDGKRFWYRVQTGPQTYEFVLVDAGTGARQTAKDLKSLGLPSEDERTSAMEIDLRPTQRTGDASELKFINRLDADVDLFWINQEGEHIRYGGIRARSDREQHTFAGHVWLITSRTGEPLAVIEATAAPQTLIIDGKGLSKAPKASKTAERGVKSPDGKWSAHIDKGRVMLSEGSNKTPKHLKTDLDGQSPFFGPIHWAPDSSAFVVSSAKPLPARKLSFIESMPKDQPQPQPQPQPKLRQIDYLKPGDPLPRPFPVIFRITATGFEWTPVKPDLFPNPFTQSNHVNVRWAPASDEFYFDYNQRGHQLYRILAAKAATGEVRVVLEETSKTFIDYTQKTWRHWVPKTGELLWMSERDGWCHLWLYDAPSGQLKNPVTRGSWPVRKVLHVDDTKRQVWFMASGLNPNEDPYHEHLCRVNFDGTGFKQLTESDGQHQIEFSPDRKYFTTTWSRADHPPVHELRRSIDGSLVCLLEKAEADQLLAAGWTMPERFVAKGRDGRTDIHGVIIKPSHFDPKKKYPVVEEIYAGPHSAFAPKTFGRLLRHHQMAELGFIIVQLDGMGTNHRGKAFHDVCWKNLKDAGYPDRIAWIKAAAQTRPWMDLTRVGIYGGSAGGQNAMRALLDHHDFYHVAVADCGCHDNRMDKIWWNEQWMGWPVDDSYTRSSNFADAHKLQGRLLLIVGELDTNVDPASTTQIVGALQTAGKTFDYMPIIGTGHGAAETPFGSRLRSEFLVRHLKP